MSVTDTMMDRVEEKLRDLLLASADLADIEVVFRGEPGVVPTKLYPFMVLFLELKSDANSDGYGASTGVRNYRLDGYCSVDVLHKDATDLMLPDNRRANVGSYLLAKQYIEAAEIALLAWGGPYGELEQNPVVSDDGLERTVEFVPENRRNALVSRDENNYSNRAAFDFHIYTTRHTG
jgi:hypothetical protein